MMTELNINLFYMFYKNDVKKIELDHWAENADDTLSQISSSLVKCVSDDKLVKENDLIYVLLDVMKNEKLKICVISDYAVEA